MPTSTKVKNLNINELTEAQYDAAVQGGVIGANELSVLTDVNYVEPSDLATVATTGDYSDLINRPTNLVSTNTAQTISGPKTFSGDITLSGTTSIKNNTGGTNYTMLYRDATTIHVGASTSVLKLEGSGTRPAYNNDSVALLSDIPSVAVSSVNGQTGTVVLTASDVGAATTAQGAKADTAVQPGDLATVATTGAYSDLSGTPTIPTVGDGTITITQGGVTKGTFTTNQSGNTTIDVDAGGGGGLPSQTGNAGKFLTTDGTDASWSDNIQITGSTGTYGITAIGINTDVSTSTSYGGIGIGHSAKVTGAYGVSIGANTVTNKGVSIGKSAESSGNGISIGGGKAPNGGIHIGMFGTNSTQSTMTVSLGTTGLNYHMYTLLDSDGTIPEARLADTTNAQQGDVLTLDANGDAVWQAGGSGGGLPSQTGNAGKFLTTDGTDASWSDKPLVNTAVQSSSVSIATANPSSAYHSINIGPSSSVTDGGGIAIGENAKVTGSGGIAIIRGTSSGTAARETVLIGSSSSTPGQYGVFIGSFSGRAPSLGSVVLGGWNDSTSNAPTGTFWVTLRQLNGFVNDIRSYQILDFDGTIPAARHAALPAADGTYTLQLVITNGVPTLSWVAV